MNLLLLSGSELAKKIRSHEVSAREVLEVHIKHAIKSNPKINAIVKDRFDEARKDADQADQFIKKNGTEQLPPFYGVPGTIKESIALAAMPQTCGLVTRRNFIAKENATVVSRYLSAGIIPIGVTNTSELCMWSETYNNIYKRTNNPYNNSRVAGGSSGGEGAIIGAGASPFGLGSDIAGSLRFPAFFNGIFSHKPTHDLVPNTGHFPIYPGELSRFNCIGPLARRAEDLYPLLKILQGADGKDVYCRDQILKEPNSVDISKLKIFNIETNGIKNINQELLTSQNLACAHLKSKGADCQTITIDNLKHSTQIIRHTFMKANRYSIETLLGEGARFNLPLEILKCLVRSSNHIFPVLGLVAYERYYKNRINDQYIKMGLELQEELRELLGENGVLLFPTYTRCAPRHHWMLFLINDWTYAAIFNILKMPVTQIPLGLNAEGLPLGLQAASLPGQDHLTIAVALELEKKFGGWVGEQFFV